MRIRVAQVVLLSWLILLAGCSSTPKADWGSRVGHYTYDEAVADMGPPEASSTLTDGTRVARWLTQRGTPVPGYYAQNTQFSTPRWWVGPVPYHTYPAANSYLLLTFSPDGQLAGWKRETK